MDETSLWRTKLAARLHDPIEKALILMRTREGHERAGSAATLLRELGLEDPPEDVRRAVRSADQWASAMDRAAFPNRRADGRHPRWQQVAFEREPVIIHPLSGAQFRLDPLRDVDPDRARDIVLEHLRGLIHADDPRRTALAFWRFGPELHDDEIGALWGQLPADTRVPDHSIHDHLDLTAALATAFAADGQGPALLAVSLGPVQAFINASRSTSDLWAGSHLLSRLAWEAMRVVCERYGPEAIVFPRLRAVPQVDLWLREDMGLRADLFQDCAWTRSASDANPLFAAALPNRFTALVPAGQARALAEAIVSRVRDWTRARAEAAYRELLRAADIEDTAQSPGYAQIAAQLADFPEVHWAAVPWSLVQTDANGRVEAGTPDLRAAMQPFFDSEPPGYLASPAWQLLSREVKLEEGWFWWPNPGALYPALHELLERALAATKAARPFAPLRQEGWRDSLSGEAEWLTHDRDDLDLPPGKREDTLWSRVAARRPAWVGKGEHLGALHALKRLWPHLFVGELKAALGLEVGRFVVSSHTLAIAGSLARALEGGRALPEALACELNQAGSGRVALPRRLDQTLRGRRAGREGEELLRRLPGWLEAVREEGDEPARQAADRLLKAYLGTAPEAYYGLALMDGDRMGAWLAADGEMALAHEQSFHPQIRAALAGLSGESAFAAYARAQRAPSPSRHMAISEALNHFALTLAPAVVEARYHGRLLYAGGDDLMALFPVTDLLPAMAELRAAYSGVAADEIGLDRPADDEALFEQQDNGFILHRGRLLRVMGRAASASCGAVIAHHRAPLVAVLRELRAAEARAKEEGGRNAFSLSVVKRAGGALRFTAHWGEPLRVLMRLRAFLCEPAVSRRAVYHSIRWLRELPEPRPGDGMLAALLACQLERQCQKPGVAEAHKLGELCAALVSEALGSAAAGGARAWIENLLAVAEFLARETRGLQGRGAGTEEDAA